MVEIVSIGEALVEVMRPRDGAPLAERGTFLGPYPSGAPAIFADAAARLGHDAGFVGCVGADAFGRCLSEHLRSDGVNMNHLAIVSETTTGVAFVRYEADDREFLYHMENAAAGMLSPEMVPVEYVADASVFHLNGSTIAVSDRVRDACRRALEVAVENDVSVSLDPNLRTELLNDVTPAELLDPFLSNCDMVSPTAAEAKSMAGVNETDAAVEWFFDRGCDLVALKRGADGATLYTDSKSVAVDPIDVTEVDPTGAGDAFGAGIVTAMLEDRSLREIGRFAAVVGGEAVSAQGPMEGLPTRDRVDSILESAYD